MSGREMLQAFLLGTVHEVDANLVVAGLQTAVERHVVEPIAERRGWYAPTEHAFEVNDQVKRHALHVVGVDQ